MELKLNEKQFEKLLKLVYLGMWVVEAEEEEQNNYFTEIEQLIYSSAKEIPKQVMIEYDSSTNTYFPGINFDNEEIIVKLIDSYEESIFWDELIDRLTKRDMIKKYGLDAIQKMSQDKIQECESQFIDKYENEFHKVGIENLVIQSKS